MPERTTNLIRFTNLNALYRYRLQGPESSMPYLSFNDSEGWSEHNKTLKLDAEEVLSIETFSKL